MIVDNPTISESYTTALGESTITKSPSLLKSSHTLSIMHSTAAYILLAFGMASWLQGTLAQTTVFLMNNAGILNCPGILRNDNGNGDKAYCCVGGELNLSTCEGWPICTGSSWEPKPITCATTVPVTAEDYSAQIRSARSKYLQDEIPSITDSSMSFTTEDRQEATASVTSTAVRSTQSTSGVSVVMPSLVGILVGALVASWIGL